MVEVDDELVGEWEIDAAHTRIGFSARHAMVVRVRGAFNELEGRIHIDAGGPARSSVAVRLKAASVDTRNAQRDAHLRSADFFDVERYPDIDFRSSRVVEVEPRMFMVVGALSIRDVTREVALPVELRGVGRGADGELRAGFEGTKRVDRREWGLEWQVALDAGSVLVSERVTMEFEISAVKLPVGSARGTTSRTPPDGAHRPDEAGRTEHVPSTARSGGRHRAPSSWFSRMRGRR